MWLDLEKKTSSICLTLSDISENLSQPNVPYVHHTVHTFLAVVPLLGRNYGMHLTTNFHPSRSILKVTLSKSICWE